MAKSAHRDATDRDHDVTPIHPHMLVLAMQAADQATLLGVMVTTYVALEKLISNEQDALERATVRKGLSTLLRSVNGEAERQVRALVQNTASLYALVAEHAGLD